jgi:molecular chaperone HtpG
MYGEPRHTLREYVQNAFDSIRSARRLKNLTGAGKVTVTLATDLIKVRDNGMGVSKSQAYRTLTSVGASKKDRQRDAGFRGIGRLAGMAYCDTLIFETTFPGETTLTTVTFDCVKLLKAMDPDSGGDMELSTLLNSAITFAQNDEGATASDHYFEVRMSGLSHAPDNLKNHADVCAYLSETVPVAYDPTWRRAKEIEAGYRAYFGTAIETVDVFVAEGGVETQIYKPYGDHYEHANGETELEAIDFEQDADSRFWGWIGRTKEAVTITDWKTRGLRVRVRNIQVDGTQLVEKLFSEVKPSYGRLSAYYVGEIHIAPELVVPNARRDGFEEKDEWLEIRKDLVEGVCTTLALAAYEASRDKQQEITKVVKQVGDLKKTGARLTQNSKASYEQVVDLLTKARRIRRNATAALKVASSVDATLEEGKELGPNSNVGQLQDAAKDVEAIESQARMLIGRFMEDDEKIASLRARIRSELIEEVLAIVNAHVDPPTYQAIRRSLQALP